MSILKPEPYDEDMCYNKFWKPDPFDMYLPRRKGFITDFVFRHRGMEIPTIYTVWSALAALSMAAKRDAWLKFGDLKKYANLYIMLIGPAGLVRKTAVIGEMTSILRDYPNHITDKCLKKVKQFVTVMNKITPEGLIATLEKASAMLPGGLVIPLARGKIPIIDKSTGLQKVYRRKNEQLIIVPELAELLGKQSYMESMTVILTTLYDNHERWSDITKNGRPVLLKELFTSFIGATTPTGFRDSIPASAKGDGFLTRMIVVYVTKMTRRYAEPLIPVGAPDLKELGKRLAWIGIHTSGEYKLTSKARDFYYAWYDSFKDDLEQHPENAGINARLDNHLLRVAMLLRISRYMEGREIDDEDLEDAANLLRSTTQTSRRILDEVASGEFGEWVNKMDAYIRERGKATRRDILRSFSNRLTAKVLTEIIDRLAQEGRIEITTGNGKKGHRSSSNGSEVYTYTEVS